MPSSYACFQTGVMINSVKNKPTDVITWLGGSCCVPKACRKSPSTITIRMKLVVISSTAGARLRTVSSSITWMVEVSPSGLVHTVGPPESMLGNSTRAGLLGDSCARAGLTADKIAKTAIAAMSRGSKRSLGGEIALQEPSPSLSRWEKKEILSPFAPRKGVLSQSERRQIGLVLSRSERRQRGLDGVVVRGSLNIGVLQRGVDAQGARDRFVTRAGVGGSLEEAGRHFFAAELLQHLAEGFGRALRMRLATQASQAVNFQRVGDFGQGFGNSLRQINQQDLISAADEMGVLPAGQ